MNYNSDVADSLRQVGVYVGRILKAENLSPCDNDNIITSIAYEFDA